MQGFEKKDIVLEKKEEKKEVVVEKKSLEPAKNPLASLAALPKLPDKAGGMKLQPISNQKKITNLRSFDVLADEEMPIKHEEKPLKHEEKHMKYEISPKSSIDEDIEEDLEIEEEHKEYYESQATSSMGVDASVNSLALEDFDHIENIRPPKKK